jgi:hypothetical protein
MRVLSRITTAIVAVFLTTTVVSVPANAASEGIEGEVVNAKTGAAVPHAWVEAYTAAGWDIGGGAADDSGHFDLYWLNPGQYRLKAIAQQFDDGWTDVVTSPGTATVKIAPFEFGSVAGGFTTSVGRPVSSARVELRDDQDNQRDQTATDAGGKFRFDHVKTGRYTLKFGWPGRQEQYWPGVTDPYSAGIVTVTADKETVVNESALPTGKLIVTVTDEQTGAPIQGAYVSSRNVLGVQQQTDANGRADFGTVRALTYSFSISPPQGYLGGSVDDVVVRSEETTQASATVLKEGVFSVTFQDAATGAPVNDACVSIQDSNAKGVVDTYYQRCAYGTDKVRVGMYWPGRYRLFAVPKDSAHGTQWVGAQGGTGDPEKAQWFEIKPGVTTGVRVRLDGAGKITGVVTDANTGAPVSEMCPSVTPMPYWYYQPIGVSCTYTDGRYTIDGVGPYDWPVQFADRSGKYAWQWSGDKPDRFAAEPVKVTAGAAKTLDAKLRPGGTLTGKIVGATIPFYYTSVNVVNARTGDWAGSDGRVSESYGYTVSGLNSQLVKITYSAGSESLWYPRPVAVSAGRALDGPDLRVPAG